MRLRSPAQFYIKSLIVHPDALATADIIERLREADLDHISEQYIDGLRGRIKPPTPFYPTDKLHLPSMEFLIQERLLRVFQPDESMKMAQAILDTPRAKECVESMTLIRTPIAALAMFVSRQYNTYCTAAGLEYYLHYFWNLDLLDSSQMRLVINLRYEQAATDPSSPFKDKKKLLDAAYFRDPRRLAADLPANETSARLVQQKTGLTPLRQDFATQLAAAQGALATRLNEVIHQDSVAGSQKAVNYANSARILEELLQMVQKPEDQLKKQLRSLAMKTDTATLPSIHQLSQGQHTVDVAPLEEDSDGEP